MPIVASTIGMAFVCMTDAVCVEASGDVTAQASGYTFPPACGSAFDVCARRFVLNAVVSVSIRR